MLAMFCYQYRTTTLMLNQSLYFTVMLPEFWKEYNLLYMYYYRHPIVEVALDVAEVARALASL